MATKANLLVTHKERLSVPSAGRSGWQRVIYSHNDQFPALSVPSAGRSGWQHDLTATEIRTALFQYPQRVVVDGNPTPQDFHNLRRDFQYPQRVVVDGNR